jgi:hypothetical protein
VAAVVVVVVIVVVVIVVVVIVVVVIVVVVVAAQAVGLNHLGLKRIISNHRRLYLPVRSLLQELL